MARSASSQMRRRPAAPAAVSGGARPDVPVRITLVENRRAEGTPPAILGDGKLLDPLEVGEPARLAVDGGPVLVTGEVLELERLGPHAVRVETDHSVYRLDFLERSPA